MTVKDTLESVELILNSNGNILVVTEDENSGTTESLEIVLSTTEDFFWADGNRLFRKNDQTIFEYVEGDFVEQFQNERAMSYSFFMTKALGIKLNFDSNSTSWHFRDQGGGEFDAKIDDIWSFPIIGDQSVFLATLNPKNKIASFNYKGELQWQLDISKLGTYLDHDRDHSGRWEHQICLIENTLVIPITENKVLGVDSKSGDVSWNCEYIPNECSVHNEELYCFSDTYKTINHLSGEEINSLTIPEQLKMKGYDTYCEKLVTEEYIFTVGNIDTVICKWDKTNGRLLDEYRIHPENETGRTGLNIPRKMNCVQYNRNTLYVKDSSKTLHVIEV